ncbi:MAG: response regulator [Burkholderiales bacterium]|nr:response regulator [Burkholderiales bacterium]
MRGVERAAAVLIVEEHPAVRRALREFIGALRPELRLIEACCAQEAQALAAAERPRMVLMDFSLTDGEAFGAIRRIQEGAPGCCVVAVSVHDDQAHRDLAATGGAVAYITKRRLACELPELLEREIRNTARAAAKPAEDVP